MPSKLLLFAFGMASGLTACADTWWAHPNWIETAGDAKISVAYRISGPQTPVSRYEVAALSTNTPLWNPDTGHAVRVVQQRSAVMQAMAAVCGRAIPTIESEVTTNPYATFYSVSCLPDQK